MRFTIMISLLFSFSFWLFGQKNIEREILIYYYHSKIFEEIENRFLDSLSSKFNCGHLDLAAVSIADSLDFFNLSITPRRGLIYKLIGRDNCTSERRLGFITEHSTTIYLIQERELYLLKKIGHFDSLYIKPFLSHVLELNNHCLNKNNEKYSEVNYTFNVAYNCKIALEARPPSIFVIEKD